MTVHNLLFIQYAYDELKEITLNYSSNEYEYLNYGDDFILKLHNLCNTFLKCFVVR